MKKIRIGILLILATLLGYIYLSTEPHTERPVSNYKTYDLQSESPLILSGSAKATEMKSISEYIPSGTKISSEVSDKEQIHQGALLVSYVYPKAVVEAVRKNILSDQQKIADLNQKMTSAGLSSSEQAQLYNLNIKLQQEFSKTQENSVRAPYTGYISKIHGKYYFLSKDTTIETSVSEYDFYKVKEGSHAIIKSLPTGEKHAGEIRYRGLVPDNSSSPSRYKVNVHSEDFIQYGFSTTISIPSKRIQIPSNALVGRGFFIKRKHKAVYKKNSVYYKYNTYFIVPGRASIGDKVILNPKRGLKNGDKIN